MDTPKNRIREIRKAKGLTLQQLADLAGTTHQTVQRLEKAERKLSQEWMERIGRALGVPPAVLLPTGGQIFEPSDAPFVRLDIRGEVQAGNWREAVELPVDERKVVHVPRPDGHRRYFGMIARGTSMDLLYPDGTILVCVPIGDYDHALAHGLKVIVERRDDHGLFEATVKELRQHADGSVWLWPRSTDPLHQAPIPMPRPDEAAEDHAGAANVRITAIVVSSVRPEEPVGPPIVWA